MSDSKQMEDLQRELDTLKEREKSCATMGEAQKVALVKAFQECCDALGIDSMRTSPADLVREVTRRCSVRPTTGSRSEPPTPDRRTGPPDRRLNKWWKSPKLPDTVEYPRRALVSCFGRRSTDKR